MKNTRKMMAFLIGITLLTISPAYADHDRAVTTEQMPRQAQEFIARYFPGEKIAYAKKESDFFEVIYEVMFTNGSKVGKRWIAVIRRYPQESFRCRSKPKYRSCIRVLRSSKSNATSRRSRSS
jgi:hypothetical protein